MGKAWDDDKGGRKQWIAWVTEVMVEAMRVMKPGAHGLVWALPRTSHWTATALEDAGFEIRDVVTHLFGSGFPKSYNIAQSIEKTITLGRARRADRDLGKGRVEGSPHGHGFENLDTGGQVKLTTDAAKQWQGFGTALKPASEHWILIRKPCSEKTVAANVLKWGCGAINIDASRIGSEQRINKGVPSYHGSTGTFSGQSETPTRSDKVAVGRFPANLVLDEDAAKMLGEPSRFFYCAKASKSDKNAGLEGMPEVQNKGTSTHGNGSGSTRMANAQERERGITHVELQNTKNSHPTVKSTKLMSYLITMVTPPGGTVLDCFAGSGSTGVAALKSGFKFVGIERDPDYFAIAEKRISKA